jgi:hypothetical protein
MLMIKKLKLKRTLWSLINKLKGMFWIIINRNNKHLKEEVEIVKYKIFLIKRDINEII